MRAACRCGEGDHSGRLCAILHGSARLATDDAEGWPEIIELVCSLSPLRGWQEPPWHVLRCALGVGGSVHLLIRGLQLINCPVLRQALMLASGKGYKEASHLGPRWLQQDAVLGCLRLCTGFSDGCFFTSRDSIYAS